MTKVKKVSKSKSLRIIGWPGGKGDHLDRLTSLMPPSFNTYHEPFAGGAALFYHLARTNHIQRATLNDQLKSLMTLKEQVRDNVEGLIVELNALVPQRNKDTFNRLVLYYNAFLTGKISIPPVHVAAIFMYLNRMGFNAVHRVNGSGEFNIPYRKDPNRDIVRAAQLREASGLLQNADLLCGDYRYVLTKAIAGDLVYFDPPYYPLSKTSCFTSYSGVFGPKEQEELAGVCRELTARGVYVMLSNSDHSEVRRLWSGWDVQVLMERRGVNSDGAKRNKIPALVFRNFM